MTSAIAKRLAAIKQKIFLYEEKYQRRIGSISLLAASKGQSIARISAAYAAGQRLFGENYLQEALKKISALQNHNIEWHFIGDIQSNKTRKIAEFFSWVHSLTDAKIASRLNEQRPLHLPPLNVCIEVNISDETSKTGVKEEAVLSLAQYCQTLPQLKLRGLMAIPVPEKDVEKQRANFRKLYLLRQDLLSKGILLNTLSMGMSEDFEAAIAEGATIVRIGRSLFGERKRKKVV